MSNQPSFADLLLENTIISLSRDANGTCSIKFLGYFYYCENNDTPESNYRIVDYCGFEVPLAEVLKKGFEEYESENGEQYKQYVADLNEEEVVDACETYNNGSMPIPLLLSKLSEQTPDGCYIILKDGTDKTNNLLKTIVERGNRQNTNGTEMNKYKVTIQEVTTTYMYVDAKDEQEAKAEAMKRFNNGDPGHDDDNYAFVQDCTKED